MTKVQRSLFIYKICEINTFAWSSWVLPKHRGNGTVGMEHLGKAGLEAEGSRGIQRRRKGEQG